MRLTKLVALPLAGLALTLSFGGGVAHADGNAPAGNNGTIKIDGAPFDDGKDNEPHPGCAFSVEFFGYDAGDRTAVLEFEAQAPTDGGALRTLTEHFVVAERTGGSQFDDRVVVDLSEALAPLTPHPKQGYHVKLTVHVDGAQGADVKHKVFWVSECDKAGPFVADTATPPTPAVPSASVLAAEEEARARAAAAARAAELARTGGSLPRTGSASGSLALAALTMIALGGAFVTAGRRRHATR